MTRERYIPPNTPIHAQRFERWLGADRVAKLSRDFHSWYGPPVKLLDVPGNVWVTGGGDFIGHFNRGYFGCAIDAVEDHVRRLWRESGRVSYGQANAGFTSISDALSRASGGFRQPLNGVVLKIALSAGVAGRCWTHWRSSGAPAAGSAASAAPGGRAPTKATTGAMAFNNPAAGTLRLTGADITCNVVNNSIMLTDRIFDVTKTMNSTATEAVTGVPTRFQSTTTTSEDYIGGNFLQIEVGATALAATAHNWTVCTYLDQDGAASTLPSVTGISAAAASTTDMPTGTFFAPLEAGDNGIQALTQMQCSAAVATGLINFVIHHPLGVMAFPIAAIALPFDWLTNRDQAPYIPNDACVGFFEMPKPSTTAATFTGAIYATSTAS